jgi:hypothetical protein
MTRTYERFTMATITVAYGDLIGKRVVQLPGANLSAEDS